MRIGRFVQTKRSGHGYVFDCEERIKVHLVEKKVKVHIIDHNFEFTGKIVRCYDHTLNTIGILSR